MNQTTPRIPKLPFIAGDVLLLGAAAWLAWNAAPLDGWRAAALVAAVAAGAWLAVWPFILQFRAETKLSEVAEMSNVTAQLDNLEAIARQISSATSEWQHVHQSATQAVTAADHIAERMTLEAKNFGEVFTRLNESEKSHLRLETEKLRRAEGEWLQIVVRMLDHVHALHQAGVRSGQRNLIEQLSSFQNTCRDTVRRIGLVPVLPPPGTVFDAQEHKAFDGQSTEPGVTIAEILAPGFTFQGRLIRLPLVTTIGPAVEGSEAPPEAQLSFEDPQ